MWQRAVSNIETWPLCFLLYCEWFAMDNTSTEIPLTGGIIIFSHCSYGVKNHMSSCSVSIPAESQIIQNRVVIDSRRTRALGKIRWSCPGFSACTCNSLHMQCGYVGDHMSKICIRSESKHLQVVKSFDWQQNAQQTHKHG